MVPQQQRTKEGNNMSTLRLRPSQVKSSHRTTYHGTCVCPLHSSSLDGWMVGGCSTPVADYRNYDPQSPLVSSFALKSRNLHFPVNRAEKGGILRRRQDRDRDRDFSILKLFPACISTPNPSIHPSIHLTLPWLVLCTHHSRNLVSTFAGRQDHHHSNPPIYS